MDIIGYVFLAAAAIALILGLVKGLASTLLGLVSAVGSVAVAIIFTPTVCEMDFVKNLIEDTPIVINGTEMFYLRTVIVFCVLFLLTLIAILAIKAIFKSILKRVKVLRFIDRLLGAALNVVVVWGIFGILFTLSNAGTEWLAELDGQLAEAGINLGLAELVGNLMTTVNGSAILQSVYSAFNPIGDLVGGMLFA